MALSPAEARSLVGVTALSEAHSKIAAEGKNRKVNKEMSSGRASVD